MPSRAIPCCVSVCSKPSCRDVGQVPNNGSVYLACPHLVHLLRIQTLPKSLLVTSVGFGGLVGRPALPKCPHRRVSVNITEARLLRSRCRHSPLLSLLRIGLTTLALGHIHPRLLGCLLPLCPTLKLRLALGKPRRDAFLLGWYRRPLLGCRSCCFRSFCTRRPGRSRCGRRSAAAVRRYQACYNVPFHLTRAPAGLDGDDIACA